MNSFDDVLRDAFTWVDWCRKSNDAGISHNDEAVAVEGILRSKLRESIKAHMKEEMETSAAMMRLETDIAELLEPGEPK